MSTKRCIDCGTEVPTVLKECPVCGRAVSTSKHEATISAKDARAALEKRLSFLLDKSYGDKSEFNDHLVGTGMFFSEQSLENVVVFTTACKQLKASSECDWEKKVLDQFLKWLQMQLNIKSGQRERGES